MREALSALCCSTTLATMSTKSQSDSDRQDWRDKQLVQDIEKREFDPAEVTLDLLTLWNPEIYGDKHNPVHKKNRKHWSDKIQVSPCRVSHFSAFLPG